MNMMLTSPRSRLGRLTLTFILSFGLLGFASLLSADDHGAGNEVSLDQVKDMYRKDCALCHGRDGSGKTRVGRKLKVRDYTDPEVQAEMTRESMMKALKDGVVMDGEEVMEGYKEDYSEAELQAMVDLIRSFKKE